MIDLPIDIPIWLFATLLASAAVVIGIAKSGFGGGIGILAVPITANALPNDVTIAMGIMLPILIFADLFAIKQHHKHVSRRHLGWSLVGGAVGVGIGTLLFIWLEDQSKAQVNTILNLTIGGICLLFVFVQTYRMVGGKFPHVPDKPGSGVVAGSIAGVVSTLAHSAGPVMSVYLLEQQMAKRLLVGTMVMFFFILNCMKLPTYFGMGYIDLETLKVSALAAIVVPIGSVLGFWMNKRISEKWFTVVMYVGAAAAAGNMVFKALT